MRPLRQSRMSLVASFEWSFIWENRSVFLDGLWKTLQVSLIGIAGAFGVGVVLGAARAHRIPVLSQLAAVYVEVIRNTPILVQVFFVYFGLSEPPFNIRLTAFTAGWLTLVVVWVLSGLIRALEAWLALPEAKRVRTRRQQRLREAV